MSDNVEFATENSEVEQEAKVETAFHFVMDYETFPITIQDPKTGITEEYELRELPGHKRDAYLNSIRSKVNADGTVKNFEDVQASLIAMHLFPKGSDTAVKLETVRRFPSRMLDKLYNKCVKLSALEKEAELKAKKP